MDYNIEVYKEDITRRLSPFRLHHSFCVADCARSLSEVYGWDPEKAYVAGILHDVLKEQPEEEALAFFAARGIALTPVEKAAPKLWHAMAGAAYIEEVYGLPADIVTAVRWHTTGRAHMSLAEKILFTADFISADRDYPGVDDMRARARQSLELAMEEGLRFTIFELSERRRAIHPDTLAAYNEILLGGNNDA